MTGEGVTNPSKPTDSPSVTSVFGLSYRVPLALPVPVWIWEGNGSCRAVNSDGFSVGLPMNPVVPYLNTFAPLGRRCPQGG